MSAADVVNFEDQRDRLQKARSLKDQIKKANRATIPFKLKHTGGIEIEVMRPSFEYLMTMGKTPDHIREIVNAQIKSVDGDPKRLRTKSQAQLLDEVVREHGIDVATYQADLIITTAEVGFVVPQITRDKAKADADPAMLHVDDVDWRDLEAFYAFCNREVTAEAEAVKSPARATPAGDDVDDVPASEGLWRPSDADNEGVGLAERSDQV